MNIIVSNCHDLSHISNKLNISIEEQEEIIQIAHNIIGANNLVYHYLKRAKKADTEEKRLYYIEEAIKYL